MCSDHAQVRMDGRLFNSVTNADVAGSAGCSGHYESSAVSSACRMALKHRATSARKLVCTPMS